MKSRLHGSGLGLSAAITAALTIGLLASGTVNAAGPAPVGLGTAAPFAVLAGTPAVTNTGPTTITGDVGISPGAAVTGFPPGTVNGAIHKADAVAVQAKSDLVTAYNDAAGRAVTATHGTLGGLTLVGGVYTAGGVTLGLTGTLTLDGQNDPNSVWIFKATSDLITASSSKVTLIRGASPCNVFWQVTSSATLGSNSTFVGTIMALTSITMASGVTVNGRALARNGQVTLIDDTITNSCAASPAPSASASASTAAASASASSAAASASASSPGGHSAAPTARSTTRASAPPTSTSTTDLPGSGPLPVLLVGLLATFLLAFVLIVRRRLPRATDIR